MSPKTCSLAIGEEKTNQDVQEYKPELKVIINKRYIEDSESNVAAEPVTIRGTITVSF